LLQSINPSISLQTIPQVDEKSNSASINIIIISHRAFLPSSSFTSPYYSFLVEQSLATPNRQNFVHHFIFVSSDDSHDAAKGTKDWKQDSPSLTHR